MKGIINKGIKAMVQKEHGAGAWARVQRAAGCDEPFFATSEDYPDETTERLIAAVADMTGEPAEQVMIRLGAAWVESVGVACYPTFFRLAGGTAREFLGNLDRIHRQITRNVPTARPPRFELEERPDGDLVIHYHSRRRLCALAQGLLVGVARHFGEDLAVRKTACASEGHAHCILEVSFP